MKKTKYKIKKKEGMVEIEGTVFNNVWGIDKRETGYYVLTYIPNGCFVASARTMKTLKLMIQEPEFFDFDGTKETLPPLKDAIKRTYDKLGWAN